MILGALLLLATLSGNWTTHGPHGGRITALVAATPDARVLYAGNAGGVFRSDDGGRSWRNVSGIAGESLRNVTLLAVDPVDPDTVLAARQIHEYLGEVYKTTDGGAHWTRLALPSPLLPRSIVFDPSDRNTIYIGSDCQLYFLRGPRVQFHEAAGVFRSTDGGATWTNVKTQSVCVESLTLDPLDPAHLFVRMDFGGRSESLDRGTTWVDAPSKLLPTDAVVVDPRDGTTRYGITNSTIARFLVSTDHGATWETREPAGVTGRTYASLTVDPGTGRLFLGTEDGLFRSGDGGRTWLNVTSIPPALVSDTVVDPATRTIVTATAFGAYTSGFPYAGAEPLAMADAGTNVTRLVRDPSDARRLFAATEDDASSGMGWEGRVFRSRTGGTSWELVPQPTTDAFSMLDIDVAGEVYAARRGGATLYRLTRDGALFEPLPHEFNSIHDVHANPSVPGTVYVFALFGSFVSRDRGLTWEPFALPSLASFAIHPTNPNVMAGTSFDSLFYTSDGVNWQRDEIQGQRPNAIAIAPSNASVFYFVMEGGSDGRPSHTVARTDNGGRSWRRMTAPAEGESVVITALAVDPQDARKVWAATSRGLFVSTDGAVSWLPANAGLPTTNLRAITIAPDNSAIHVATDRGVWTRARVGRRRAVR
ncbi:MAG TPA: hypothetical protein VHK90_07665 [Thermoanaerobaculia bacterium]|nr:hypothetical protein [Thermoanaerobaculia bacterium]